VSASFDEAGKTASRPVVSPLRAIGVIFVFAVVGPPVGGFIWLAMTAILTRAAPIPWSIEALLLLLISSYLLGTSQALGVGVVASLWQYHKQARRLGLMPIIFGSCAFSLVLPVIAGLFWQHHSMIKVIPFLGINVGAGVCCWLLVNALFEFFDRRAALGTST